MTCSLEMHAAPELASRIDAVLPQTQCTRCGYPTCRAYAEAIGGGEADIDRCPPGGEDGVAALAALLGRATKPLNPDYGVEQPPLVAVIDEAVCIGCTKCIRACPVDAIVGAAKRMHTVITAECTGCELCLPPCPVDCIRLVPVAEHPLSRAGVLARAAHARERYEARNRRLAASPDPARRAQRSETAEPTSDDDVAHAAIDAAPTQAPTSVEAAKPAPISRSAVLEAIARGRARKWINKESP